MSDASASRPGPPSPAPGYFRRNQLLYFTLGALILGLVLGGVLVGLTRTPAPTTGAESAPTPSASGDAGPGAGDVQVTTTVPAECLEAADRASDALTAAQEGLTALSDFDAARLRQVLRTLQEDQPVIRDLAERCRSQASAGATTVPSETPSPAAAS